MNVRIRNCTVRYLVGVEDEQRIFYRVPNHRDRLNGLEGVEREFRLVDRIEMFVRKNHVKKIEIILRRVLGFDRQGGEEALYVSEYDGPIPNFEIYGWIRNNIELGEEGARFNMWWDWADNMVDPDLRVPHPYIPIPAE